MLFRSLWLGVFGYYIYNISRTAQPLVLNIFYFCAMTSTLFQRFGPETRSWLSNVYTASLHNYPYDWVHLDTIFIIFIIFLEPLINLSSIFFFSLCNDLTFIPSGSGLRRPDQLGLVTCTQLHYISTLMIGCILIYFL